MDWYSIVQTLFTVVIIPLLIVLTKYGVTFIQAKCEELKAKSDNELHDKYIDMLQDTVINCVLTTTQTYVDSLKTQGSFDIEAQKTAFEMTKNAVLNILTDDAKEYLTNAVSDFDGYLNTLIEATVKLNKTTV